MSRVFRTQTRARQGMVLFEVIIALTIFVVAGLSTVVWVRQALMTIDHTYTTVEEMRAASDYLDRIALWSREDLDRHFGTHREGRWLVEIERSAETVYAVVLQDSAGHPLLKTWFYRAIPQSSMGSIGDLRAH